MVYFSATDRFEGWMLIECFFLSFKKFTILEVSSDFDAK